MFKEMFPERTEELESLANTYGEDVESIPDICWLLKPIDVDQNDIEWALNTLKESK